MAIFQVCIDGQFKNDDVNNYATISLDDDAMKHYNCDWDKYIGNINNGVFDGKGELEWADKCIYMGVFEKGLRHGQGSIKKGNKEVFSGHWTRDIPDGQATMEVHDHKVYDGNLVNGKKEEDGYLKYGGNFVKGKREGYGYLKHGGGEPIYDGLWMDDLPNQRGFLASSDGNYDGEFKDGKRHGKGLFKFNTNPAPNGNQRVFEGDWKNDVPDGVGRYVNEHGQDRTYKLVDNQ